MDRLIRILNVVAFCFSLAALLLIVLLAFGQGGRFMDPAELNRNVSNMVGGYCCCYGLAQWLQESNRTMAIGLMVIGTLIIAANIVAAQ